MSGKGVHRMTYWEEPYAYVTGSEDGWIDQFLIIVDLSDPSNPREVGRWWMPGQHAAGGEQLNLPLADLQAPSCPRSRRPGLLRLVGQGLIILDIADKQQLDGWSASSTSAPTSAARPTPPARCPAATC